MSTITLYPSAPPAGVDLGASGATVTNIGGSTVDYSDRADPFVTEGSLAAAASATLTGTQFFRAASGSTLRIIEADSDLGSLEAIRAALLEVESTQVIDVRTHGAKGDNRRVSDGAMTLGSAVLTSATAAFTSADIGKLVRVESARGSEQWNGVGPISQKSIDTTIVSVQSATQATLAATAVVTVSGKTVNIGTDDTAAIQAAIDAASALGTLIGARVTVRVPDKLSFRTAIITSPKVRVAIPTIAEAVGSTLDMFYALRVKSNVDVRIDGEVFFPLVGDHTPPNWVMCFTALPADTNWTVSGSGRIFGGAIADAGEWLHQAINPVGSSRFDIHDLDVTAMEGDQIRVDGSQVNGTAGGAMVIASDFAIRRTRHREGVSQAIEVPGGRRYRIVDNDCRDGLGASAETIFATGWDFTVARNEIWDWESNGDGSAIKLQGGSGVHDATIEANNSDQEITYATVINRATIRNNRVRRVRAAGTDVETDVTVDNNRCSDVTTGVSLGANAASSGFEVNGNRCVGSILINLGADASVRDNRCTSLDIRVPAEVIGNRASVNANLAGADSLFSDNRVLSTTSTALLIAAPRCRIADNILKTTATNLHAIFGTSATTVDDAVIEGNTLSSATGNALNLNGPSSKLRVVSRNNTVLAGTIVGVTDSTPMVPAEAGLRMIRGRVAADGTVEAGSGFTIAALGSGTYTVTYTTAFSAAPLMVTQIRSQTAAYDAVSVYSEATTGCTLVTRPQGAPANTPFGILVVGPA